MYSNLFKPLIKYAVKYKFFFLFLYFNHTFYIFLFLILLLLDVGLINNDITIKQL